jgi:hypothetical protein
MDNETVPDQTTHSQPICPRKVAVGRALRVPPWLILGMGVIAIGGGLTIALGPWPSWVVFGMQAGLAALLIVAAERKGAR